MKILIVAAMDNEIAIVLDKLKENKIDVKEIEGFKFYLGNLYNKEIILVQSGVGRINSGILITIAKLNFDFDLIINIGLAGGLKELSIYDIVVGEKTIYGDVDVTSYLNKYSYGQMPGCPRYFEGSKRVLDLIKGDKDVHFGTICSCDKFTTNDEEVRKLINNYFSDLNVLAFDMESACFAQACYRLNIDFIAIRFISDIIGSDGQSDVYAKNEEDVQKFEKCNNYILRILEKI